MKQLSTIICSLLFVIAGAMVIGMKSKPISPTLPGAMPAYARPQPFSLNEFDLPLDVQLDLNKRTKTDTIYIDTSRVDTVYETKYKTKVRKVTVPEVVKETDTLYVPVFYLATPLEQKVESTEIMVIQGVQPDSCTETNHTGVEELE